MEKDHYVLEITLISAQGLKEPSGQLLSRIQTYAVAYIDPSHKLRTSVDRLGGANPTWNDKFLFKVTSDFLSKETSSVSVKIFSVGVLRDSSLGTVRLLVGGNGGGNYSSAPYFTAVQVRRPSGRYQGVLNIGITVLETADVPSMVGVTAIGFRDLIGESDNSKKNRSLKKSKSAIPISVENLGRECDDDDESDDCYSTTTSSSSPAVSSTALKDWNGVIRELEKTNHIRSSSEDRSLLCGLGLSNSRSSGCLSPFIFNGQSRFA